MCGVLGYYSKTNLIRKELFTKALALLNHRGPDNQATWNRDHFLLGHTRLTILDKSERANQPLEGNRGVLVYNGEIYNHQSLRNSNFKYNTSSDSETLLIGLESIGTEFLSQCQGMFTGAFFEKEAAKVYLFRDKLGVKSLYYYFDENCFVFASDIKAIVQLIDKEKLSISKDSLNQYLAYENYEQGNCFIKEIKSLKPGQVLEVSSSLEMRFTQIELKESAAHNNDNLVVQGRKIIEDSVKRHLLSDFPVGVYLSGGIDSSLVASLAVKNRADIEAFTGYFQSKDSHYDERPFSRLIAKHLKIKLHEVEITPDHFIRHFDNLIYHLETPKMGMGSFSQFVVAQEAAKHRKVILAGHGGDELFAGYPMFKAFWMGEKFGRLPKLCFKEIPWIAYFFLNKLLKNKVMFAPKIFSGIETGKGIFWGDKSQANLESLFDYYKKTYIPGLLEVEDKVSMAHSLETRVPLWDLNVINFASIVPVALKMQGGELKAFLRKVAKPYLPQEVFNAPKRGFPTPLRLWFKNELFAFIEERLYRNSELMDYAMNKGDRKLLLKSLRTKKLPFAFDEIRAHKIWMLLCLESFERQFGISFERRS